MSVFYFLKITAPLWLNADILAGPVNATTKPVGKTKFFSIYLRLITTTHHLYLTFMSALLDAIAFYNSFICSFDRYWTIPWFDKKLLPRFRSLRRVDY
jgi:hypothetical protein